MRFTSVTAGLATIFALSSLVVALPQNAGTGIGPSNSCDLRSDLIEYTYGAESDRPRKKDCDRLVELFGNKDVYPGDRVKIEGKMRTFTFQSCQIVVNGDPVYLKNRGRDFYIGFDDLKDLVNSGWQDFMDQDAKAENQGKALVKSNGGKSYAIQEDNTVKCEATDNGEQITVSYEIGKPKTGHTLDGGDDDDDKKPKKKGHKKGSDDGHNKNGKSKENVKPKEDEDESDS